MLRNTLKKLLFGRFSASTVLGLILGLVLAGYGVFAFQTPAQAPPDGNVPAPVNVGPDNQIKSGGLWVGSLGVDGGVIIGGDLQALSIIQTGGTALPACSTSNRGQSFLLQGASGVEDGLYICKKRSDETYSWTPLASPDLGKAFESSGTTVTLFGHSPSLQHDGPHGSWTTVDSFVVPEDATTWSCSFGVYEPNSFSFASCPSTMVRLLCDGELLFQKSCADYGCVGVTDIFPETSSSRNCQIQMMIPDQDCGDYPSYSARFVIGGLCTYAKAK